MAKLHRRVALVPVCVAALLVAAQPELAAARPDTYVRLLWLAATVFVLAAGLVAYLVWRLEHTAEQAWLSLALVLTGLYSTTDAVAALALREQPGAWMRVPTLEIGVATLAIAALCAAASRGDSPAHTVRGDPFAVAMLVELAVVALRSALPPGGMAPAAPPGSGRAALAQAAIAVLATAAVLAAARMRRLPPLLRAAVVGLLASAVLADAASRQHGFEAPVALRLTAVLLVLTSALVLLGCVLQHLVETEERVSKQVLLLTERSDRHRGDRERDEHRWHELRATAAGVASATRLLVDPTLVIAQSERRLLAEMVADESDRLNRLTVSWGSARSQRVPLDDVLGRVVAKQRALGQPVCWQPGRAVATADPDDLREVVDVLLVNAQHHAPGARVWVETTVRGSRVELRVRDAGPGLAPEVLDRLFQRGCRGPTSSGSGLGLHLAAGLATAMGGTLACSSPGPGAGACFVLDLPGAPTAAVAPPAPRTEGEAEPRDAHLIG